MTLLLHTSVAILTQQGQFSTQYFMENEKCKILDNAMGSFHIYPPLGPAGCWLPLRPRRGGPSRRGRDLRRPGPLQPRGRVHQLPRGPGPLLNSRG